MRLVPVRYLPPNLSAADKKKQIQMLKKSRQMYTNKKYYNRKPLSSYRNKTSKHIRRAEKIYRLDKIIPSPALVRKNGRAQSNCVKRRGSILFIRFETQPNRPIVGFCASCECFNIGKSRGSRLQYSGKGVCAQ